MKKLFLVSLVAGLLALAGAANASYVDITGTVTSSTNIISVGSSGGFNTITLSSDLPQISVDPTNYSWTVSGVTFGANDFVSGDWFVANDSSSNTATGTFSGTYDPSTFSFLGGLSVDSASYHRIDLTDSVKGQYALNGTIDLNSKTFSANVATVPEPMSIMLGIMGLGSIAGLKKFRRN